MILRTSMLAEDVVSSTEAEHHKYNSVQENASD